MLTVAVAPPAPSLTETINSFAESFEGLVDLRVAHAVDETVDTLQAETKFYRAHAVIGRAIIARIDSLEVVPGKYLDPDGTLEDGLDEVINRGESDLTMLTAKKGCIDGDPQLSKSLCDVLHGSYDDTLVALACLTEVAKDMRAAIVARDLKAEPRGGKAYSTAAELRNAILN